jgi:membrane protein DedA with SNARE-associated domain
MEATFEWIKGFADDPILLFFTVFGLSLAHMFVPPIPLESITVFASYITGTGHGSPILIWIATTVGMSVGSSIMFHLSWSQGERLLNIRWIRKQLPEKFIQKARIWFQHYGIWAVYFGKCIIGMSFVVVFCCGLFKLQKQRALPAIYLSNLIYYGVLVYAGRYVGLKWEIIAGWGWKILPWAILAVIAIGLGIWVIKSRWKPNIIEEK